MFTYLSIKNTFDYFMMLLLLYNFKIIKTCLGINVK